MCHGEILLSQPLLPELLDNYEWFVSGKTKQQKRRIAASSKLKTAQSRNKLRIFFFLGVNIKQQSVLFFRRHFRSRDLWYLYLTIICFQTTQRPRVKCSGPMQDCMDGNGCWAAMQTTSWGPRKRQKLGGGVHVLRFYYMPRTVLNTSHKL